MNEQPKPVQRVIGLDSHPDSFTAAILLGSTPAAAVVAKMFNQVPIGQLQSWAKKHTTAQDLFVLEASGNSFQVVRTLAAIQRQAKVLESCHLGKLKEAHANNDKISAVRIGKAYLAGTAKEVCLTDTEQVQEQIRKARDWSQRQWQVIQILLVDLRHAHEQRRQWRSLIAQEVLSDPELTSLVGLCGVREMVAFGLAAFIGDIKRFTEPKKLVKYIGLNPAFDDSGQEKWSGGVGGHGNKHLRCLLIEAAQAILRCSKTPLAQWGKKLLARKGSVNLAVAAIARKLAVAAWYLMMGRWTALEQIDEKLAIKVNKMMSSVGTQQLQALGKDRKTYRQQIYERLKTGRTYQLDPNTKFVPKPKPTLVEEYGLR